MPAMGRRKARYGCGARSAKPRNARNPSDPRMSIPRQLRHQNAARENGTISRRRAGTSANAQLGTDRSDARDDSASSADRTKDGIPHTKSTGAHSASEATAPTSAPLQPAKT